MYRRLALLFTLGALIGATSLLAAGPAAAGCGWPNCNPAQLAGSASRGITPPGGTSGTIRVSFSSSNPYAVPETRVTFNGSSRASWSGTKPYYASNIRLIDKWHVDGLSVSASLPAGVGITGSGSDATWDDSDPTARTVNHYFSNVRFNGLVLIGISETATGIFKFGTSSWQINAHDDCFI